MARQKYTVKNITLVSNNVNDTNLEKYEVLVDWTDKNGEVHEVKDIVLVNPYSTVYGKYPKPLHIKYPSRHTFIINKVAFSTLGDITDTSIKINVAKALLKYMYPVDGRQYIKEIF